MEIRMYECGFGDCFRLREEDQVDLYVDFGIHASSWSGAEKTRRFDDIIAEMERDKSFLLTHYHEDHFNGAIHMANTTLHRFTDVYISDVWNMPESVDVTSLTLLRGIFTRSVIHRENTIIDFLQSICNRDSRIHFISRGVRFHNDRYIALWPETNYVARKAQKMFKKLQHEIGEQNLKKIKGIAQRLNELVVALANNSNIDIDNNLAQFNALQKEYFDAQVFFDALYGRNYDNNIQYRLTKFGNEISIVFQNHRSDRSVLFTGDFGKSRNWSLIERNRDRLVEMHNYYEVVKLPHHGTDSYYHSFVSKIQDSSTLLIPNGYVRCSWNVSSKYKKDSVAVGNRTICAHCITCLGHRCPRGRCIFPGLSLDI